ncbi:Aste57867_2934 [Aphanomyces stellatus]|uniref:Aste57867_2934 protein n=1 Tax=Aphanomyces stellatus TaxID=120398 RepID=A0A485KAA8_9STRA|nr:hypothetical protein As57867_002926 [Aphanomyces stellatus]VFT80117.1 Aste57867_2934 [Aphanomyces stellatus]
MTRYHPYARRMTRTIYTNVMYQAEAPINFFLTESLNASEREVVRLRQANRAQQDEFQEQVAAMTLETERRENLEVELQVEIEGRTMDRELVENELANKREELREYERIRRHLCDYIAQLEVENPHYNGLTFKLRYGTVMNSRAFQVNWSGQDHYSTDGITFHRPEELYDSDTTLGSEDEGELAMLEQ